MSIAVAVDRREGEGPLGPADEGMPDAEVVAGRRDGRVSAPRKVVLYELTSLDGAVDEPARYFSDDPAAGVPPIFDDEMIANEVEVIGAQDAVLLGRGMYDEWSAYWPNVTGDPFADFINGVRKYVVTSRPLTRSWANASVVEGPVERFVADLKEQPGGDIGVHGSLQLAQSLLAAGLVDELRLVVGPLLGGPGRRLVPPGAGGSRFFTRGTPRAARCFWPTPCLLRGPTPLVASSPVKAVPCSASYARAGLQDALVGPRRESQ